MDETAVWVDMLAESTIENIENKTVAIKATGNQKNRFTVCLTAKANGIKLKPFIVFKGKRIDPVLAGDIKRITIFCFQTEITATKRYADPNI